MPPRTDRGQGQWAAGHFGPLNAAERVKKDDPGLNVRDRIISRYARGGFGRRAGEGPLTPDGDRP